MPGKMLSSKNSNIKSGLKNQPTPTLDKEPKISPPELSKILYYSNLADFKPIAYQVSLVEKTICTLL